MLACGRESLWWWLHTLRVTLLPWLPGFLHRQFPPQNPPPRPLYSPLCSQQQPSLWDCSTIPNSSSQPLHLPGDLHSCPGYVWLRKDCLILIPFRLPHTSCCTRSLKCFSWLRQLPWCWGQIPSSVPPSSKGRSSPTNTSVFSPSPFVLPVFHGIVFFLLVRYSCLLSASVLHALLCLKVYSWYIHGERCSPCPPTPLPSCSLYILGFNTDSFSDFE